MKGGEEKEAPYVTGMRYQALFALMVFTFARVWRCGRHEGRGLLHPRAPRMSALLCEKVVQPTRGSFSADHLIWHGRCCSVKNQPRYTAFRHQMFEFDHQPSGQEVFRQPKGDHYSIEETGTTNLAQLNQAAADYPYHSASC